MIDVGLLLSPLSFTGKTPVAAVRQQMRLTNEFFKDYLNLRARLAPRLCGAKARFQLKCKKKKCLAKRFLRNCVFKNAKK